VSEQGDLFTPEEVDTQIEQVSQALAGEQADAQALAYLRSFYSMDAHQEQEALVRIWNRIRDATPATSASSQQESEEPAQPVLFSNQRPQTQRRTMRQRLGILAAIVVVVALVGSLALLFSAIRVHPGSPTAGSPQPGASSTVLHTPTYHAPFLVTSIDIAVRPASIAGLSCGTVVTVRYTATIHIRASSPGGTITFGYTVNNGRSQHPASMHVAAGETRKTYTFTWSGPLPIDHTYPQPGGISVTSPNPLISPLLGPNGTCR
jgi:hypothetical protein